MLTNLERKRMPPRIRKKVVFQTKTFRISLASYENAMKEFRIQPVEQKNMGVWVACKYVIENEADYNEFVDYFFEKAADFADEHGDSDYRYLQMTKDAEKF